MISKERLEELIQQEATIYIICWGKIKEVSLNDLEYMDIEDDRICYEITDDKPRTTDLQHLFETKEEAERYLECKEILILGKEAFDKLNPDVQKFIKQQSQVIGKLMHENKLLKKALELACETLKPKTEVLTDETYTIIPPSKYVKYFKQKAGKELRDGTTKS